MAGERTKHPETPWRWDEPDNWHGLSARIINAKYEPIAIVSLSEWGKRTGRAICRHIVRACNSHDAMLAALLQAKSTLSDPTKDFCPHCGGPASLDDHATHCPLGIVIAAISKATEQD